MVRTVSKAPFSTETETAKGITFSEAFVAAAVRLGCCGMDISAAEAWTVVAGRLPCSAFCCALIVGLSMISLLYKPKLTWE
jgi:hypothetical protein